MQTLLDFATPKMLTCLLVKERAKCRRRNRNDKKKKHFNRECDINKLSPRKMLSRIMPPRQTWVRPSKRKRLDNSAVDTSKNAETLIRRFILMNWTRLSIVLERDWKMATSNWNHPNCCRFSRVKGHCLTKRLRSLVGHYRYTADLRTKLSYPSPAVTCRAYWTNICTRISCLIVPPEHFTGEGIMWLISMTALYWSRIISKNTVQITFTLLTVT